MLNRAVNNCSNIQHFTCIICTDVFSNTSFCCKSHLLSNCIVCCCGVLHVVVVHCMLMWCIAGCCGAWHVAVVHCMLLWCIACYYSAMHVVTVHCMLLWCIVFCCAALHVAMVQCMLLWYIACCFGAMYVLWCIACCYGDCTFLSCIAYCWSCCEQDLTRTTISESTKYNKMRQQKKRSYHFQSYSSCLNAEYRRQLELASDQDHPLLNATNSC